MTGNVSGPYGPTTPQVRLPAPILKTIQVPPVEAEYLRVRPFLALSGWSKSTLYRLNQRHSLLIKVDHATFVDLKAWRRFMAACPRVGRAR
jgi:hypothetical protein